jgi:hypothetical protein
MVKSTPEKGVALIKFVNLLVKVADDVDRGSH